MFILLKSIDAKCIKDLTLGFEPCPLYFVQRDLFNLPKPFLPLPPQPKPTERKAIRDVDGFTKPKNLLSWEVRSSMHLTYRFMPSIQFAFEDFFNGIVKCHGYVSQDFRSLEISQHGFGPRHCEVDKEKAISFYRSFPCLDGTHQIYKRRYVKYVAISTNQSINQVISHYYV